MKLKLIIFPLCLIAIHAFGFEGTVKQVIKNYNGTGSNVTMTWYLSQHNCRVDMAASGKDASSNSVLILNPASQTIKTYDANPKGDKVFFQVSASSVSSNMAIVSVSPTQESKQINGYKCEKWVVVATTGVYNVWVARDIDMDWSGYKNMLKTSVEIQALANQGVKGFPMLTESANGSNNASVESVSTQASDANTFSVPSDYKLFVPQK